MTIDHLGIAVRDLEAAVRRWTEGLGLAVTAVEEVPAERVRLAMLPVGESRVELLATTDPDGPIGRFVARHGEGLHHVAFRVADLEAAAHRAREAGLALVYDEIRTGAGGHRFVFLHPKSTGGVLVELVEAGGGEVEAT